MIAETLKQQIEQWLDGELPVEDEARLQKVLESQPEALAFLCDRALLHQMLARAAAFEANLLSAESDDSSLRSSAKEIRPHFAPRIGQPWLWASSAVAACLLVISIFFLPRVVASPAELVERTLAGFQSTLDRCYVVEVAADVPLRRKQFRRRTVPADSALWVRGESFVQIFTELDQQLVWGRNAQGAVWFTISGKAAAIFEADEVPELLQEVCELRTLQLPTLLETCLLDCELEYVTQERGCYTILARPRSLKSDSKFGEAEIEIEADSLLVRRVTLERINNSRPVATVSFSLKEVRPQPDSFYELQSYLQPDTKPFDRRTKRGRRSELLREFLQQLRVTQGSLNQR
jgi:hypothetical protein